MEEKYLTRMVALETKLEQHSKQLDEHGQKLNEISDMYVALTTVNNKIENVETVVSEMKDDIKDIKGKSEKRMDLIWGYVVSTLITAVVTYVLCQIGLK